MNFNTILKRLVLILMVLTCLFGRQSFSTDQNVKYRDGAVYITIPSITEMAQKFSIDPKETYIETIEFSGDARNDFETGDSIPPNVIAVYDPGKIGDVLLPNTAPPGTVSGWDINAVYFYYDHDDDVMYVGFDFGGEEDPEAVCGDADGDHYEGKTSDWLKDFGGRDTTNLSATESVVLLLDMNTDGHADVAIGVNNLNDISSFAAYERTMDMGFLGPSFFTLWSETPLNNEVIYHNYPNYPRNDLEFTIKDFSTLPNSNFTPKQSYKIGMFAYAGSDIDGLSEEFVPRIPKDTTFAYDYGDLPTPYPTLEADNGAFHFIKPNLFFGDKVTPDIDGQPEPNANGDYDDGITNTDLIFGVGAQPEIDIKVFNNTNESATIWGWIDYNGDAVCDSGEDTTYSTRRTRTITLKFPPIPPNSAKMVDGTTYARFRISTCADSITRSTGFAPDGEVEDYLVTIYEPASIGDWVWEDKNWNGIQDNNEPGIDNITVRLYYAQNNEKAKMDTENGGYYEFNGLAPGIYIVEFDTTNTDYHFTKLDQNGDQFDSDAIPGTGRTAPITLISGQIDTTVDAGLFKLGSIGNLVWEDLNYDGIQNDGNSAGIEGIIVNLLDNSKNKRDTYTTGNDGKYLFNKLEPDTYYVQLVKPDDHFFTLANQGNNDTLDSDFKSSTVQVILESGQTDTTIDAGLYKKVSIGDLVWQDMNGNGLKEDEDNGLDNFTVYLLNNLKNQIDTTETENGTYSFNQLDPGTYYLKFVKRDSFLFTIKDKDNNNYDTIDSDANIQSGITDPITLESGDNNNTIDAGLYKPVLIGNFVWEDMNGDGIQNIEEPGLGGVTVALLNSSRLPILGKTFTTDITGKYYFDDLKPGEYSVCFKELEGYQFTLQYQGTDSTDSNAGSDGCTAPFIVYSGKPDSTIDAGLFRTVSISGFVWEDKDRDGDCPENEHRIPGITVKLIPGSGVAIQEKLKTGNQEKITTNQVYGTTTKKDGSYSFEGLSPGTYIVEFAPNTSIYEFTLQGICSTPDPETGRTDSITLESSQSSDLVNAGLYKMAAIGDLVWEDLNYNGCQDEGEPGIKDIFVHLDTVGNLNHIKTDTTDLAGIYQFNKLDPGEYIVEFDVDTAVFKFTFKNNCTDSTDSDADPEKGCTASIKLTSGQVDNTIDAGLYSKTSIGDWVWEDIDGNGIQDDGDDTGIKGIKVRLVRQDTLLMIKSFGENIQTTVTNDTGGYKFTGLYPGQYLLQFEPDETQGYKFTIPDQATDSTDSDANPNDGYTTNVITVISSHPVDTVDAGLVKPVSIGDWVWEDINGNGIQDDGKEPGLDSVVVTLLDKNKNPITGKIDTTDNTGHYLFTDVNPGSYFIKFDTLKGYHFTLQYQGNNSTIDSDADSHGYAPCTVFSGKSDITIDAGLYRPVSIGDWVWDDLNKDDCQDNGEDGINKVSVNLILKQDTVQTISTKTVDCINGKYLFTGLRPDSYIVEFVRPDTTIYKFSEQYVCDPYRNSNANPVTGRTELITLLSGEAVDTLDAGLYKLASIGDFAWEDLNYDGVQDTGEYGIDSINVILLNDQKKPIDTTITDVTGYYVFDNLEPVDYYIKFKEPNTSYYFTKRFVGSNREIDSDADETGWTDKITLISGEKDTTIDTGLFRKASIGDWVWRDNNINGIQDAGENGIKKIGVKLLNSHGNLISGRTTETGDDGYYKFENLDPAVYIVEFVKHRNLKFTLWNAGVSAKDSDVNPSTGRTNPVTVISGQFADTVDAGVFKQVSIGDFVWLDQNGDGIQDKNEPGVDNVVVELYDSDDKLIPGKTTTTGDGGKYVISKVDPVVVRVKFIAPAEYKFTLQNQGDDDSKDSDANHTGQTSSFLLRSCGMDSTIDAGLVINAAAFATSVGEELQIPKEYSLSQNYPNPFNPDTYIKYALPKDNYVTINIYDIQGKLVRNLVAENKHAGYYQVIWNSKNNYDESVANGLYLYRMKSGKFITVRKMILLK